jgi:streptogramin lyase
MTDTRKASLTLYASPNGEGPDGIRMEVSYDGDFDPTSTVDNIINHFAHELIENAEHAAKMQAAEAKAGAKMSAEDSLKSALILPMGVSRV